MPGKNVLSQNARDKLQRISVGIAAEHGSATGTARDALHSRLLQRPTDGLDVNHEQREMAVDAGSQRLRLGGCMVPVLQ